MRIRLKTNLLKNAHFKSNINKILKVLKPYILSQLLIMSNAVLYEQTVLVEILYLCFCPCFPHWFEVGGAKLNEGDVMYFRAPI